MREVTIKQYFFWSPILGTDAVRFSVYDEHGKEFYQIHPMTGVGKSLRELRETTAENILAAMDNGAQPGQVE